MRDSLSGESPKQSESLVDLKDAGFAQSHGESNLREKGGRRKPRGAASLRSTVLVVLGMQGSGRLGKTEDMVGGWEWAWIR